MLAGVLDVGLDLGERPHHLHPVGDRQPPRGQGGVGVGLRLRLESLPGAEPVADHPQRAARGHPRVLLPQRPGRGVARVGERGLARVQQRLVQLAERLDRHEHLAPDLEGGRVPGAFQPGRDGGDRADVRRDVLAGAPVAPGGRLDQRAVPVDEVDRQPVDLEFT